MPSEEFVNSSQFLHLLAKANKVIFSVEHLNGPHMTDEIKEIANDIKVCGPAEIRKLLKWRQNVLADKKAEQPEEPVPELTPEELEQKEIDEIDLMIAQAAAEEKAKLKRQKKKLLRAKAEREKRSKLNMDADKEAPVVEEDIELFSLSKIKKSLERKEKRKQALTSAGLEDDESDEESDVERDIDSDEFEEYDNEEDNEDDEDDQKELIDEAEDALSAPQINDGLDSTERKKKRTITWFDEEVNNIIGSESEDDVDVIEKHMNRTVSKDKMHKNTVEFEDEKPKKRKKEEQLFESEEEVYRSDEEYDKG